MAKHWEKEDRHCWQKSEVMQNFEKTILDNYSALEVAQLKLAQMKTTLKDLTNPALETQVKKTTEAVTGLSKALNSADDGLNADLYNQTGTDDQDLIIAQYRYDRAKKDWETRGGTGIYSTRALYDKFKEASNLLQIELEKMEMKSSPDTEDNAHDQSCEYSDDEVTTAKASMLSELQKMASDALAVRDMALVYKVERTIQEMLEPEDDQ